MISKIIEHVGQNISSNVALYELIKVVKAKSTDYSVIESLNEIETSIAISIKRDRVLLDILKDGLEDYSQQFASEFNLLYEVMDDKFLILSKVSRGYQVLLTAKDGGTISSKTYISQVEAIEYFVELYKHK